MDIITTLALFVPIFLVLWLANLSHRKRIEGDVKNERTLKLLAYGLLFLLYAGLMVFGGLIGLIALAELVSPGSAGGSGLPFAIENVPSMALSMILPSLLGLFLLTRPARRLFARFTPIDPANAVHAVALSLTALVLINLFFTLAMGLDTLSEIVAQSQELNGAESPAPALWVQNISFALMSLIGVGWLARRSLKAAFLRLGIVVPTLLQVAIGIGAALLMVPLVIVAEMLAAQLGLGTSAEVEKLTEQLIGPLTLSIPGVLTLGLAAGLGEESVMRGALQPRFGLMLTSLLFALLHSNYGFSFSTVAVFVVGLVLGVIRIRTNTTTAMITHAVYNMSLGLIAYLGLMQQ
jgi:uncharacterized protein